MLWKYIGRYPKFGFIIIVGPTDKKQVQMNRMHSLICNHAPQWGVKSIWVLIFMHLWSYVIFYEKSRISLRKHQILGITLQNYKFIKLQILNVLGKIVCPYQTVHVFYCFNWEIWVVVSSMHNVTSNHFSPCIYF